jgi:hypothetical protein
LHDDGGFVDIADMIDIRALELRQTLPEFCFE